MPVFICTAFVSGSKCLCCVCSSGVGPVVRAATLKSCTVVAARLALYGFVTEIVPDTVMLRLCGKEALESSSKAGSGPKSSRRLHAAATVELGMSRNQSAAQAGLASESTDATVVAHASLFMVYEVVYLYRCILSGASPVSVGQVSHFSPPRPPRKSLKATARNILAANVSQLSLLAEQSSCIPSTAHQSIGALLVLGGEGACPIGVGSRVQLPENALGVVIAFIEGTSHADVLIDGADAVSVWSISDISVLPAVPCPPAHVVLTLLDVETDPEGSFAILDTFAHVLPLLTNVASGASPDYVRSILASRTLSVLLSMAQRSSFALSKCVSHQVLGRTIEVCSLVCVTTFCALNCNVMSRASCIRRLTCPR